MVNYGDPPELPGRLQIAFKPAQHFTTAGYRTLERRVGIQADEVNVSPVERVVPATVGKRYVLCRYRVRRKVGLRFQCFVFVITRNWKVGHNAEQAVVDVEVVPLKIHV